MVKNESAQVGQRAALSYEVVDEQVIPSADRFSLEYRRTRHALPASRAGVIHPGSHARAIDKGVPLGRSRATVEWKADIGRMEHIPSYCIS